MRKNNCKHNNRVIALIMAIALIGASLCPVIASAEELPTSDLPDSIPVVGIVVGFSDIAYNNDYDWNNTIFHAEKSPANFYKTESNGTFTFTPAKETSAYNVGGNTNTKDQVDDGVIHVNIDSVHGDMGDYRTNSRSVAVSMLEALAKADEFIDFSSFDKNNDGIIENSELAIVFVTAGYDSAYFRGEFPNDMGNNVGVLTTNNCLWPHANNYNAFNDLQHEFDGVVLGRYVAIAENLYYLDVTDPDNAISYPMQSRTNVLNHELGHFISNPDLYNLSKAPAIVDNNVSYLDTMCSDWCSNQYKRDSNINWHNGLSAWTKLIQGWANPTVVTSNGEYNVYSELSTNGYNCLVVPTGEAGYYYLVENRRSEGEDAYFNNAYDIEEGTIKANGIVVYLINMNTIRDTARSNGINNVDQIPGIMPIFPLKGKDETTQSDVYTYDYFNNPYGWIPTGFNFGNNPFMNSDTVSGSIELPIYYSEFQDTGYVFKYKSSGVKIAVEEGNSRDGRVKIEGLNEVAGNISSELLYDSTQMTTEYTDLARMIATSIACYTNAIPIFTPNDVSAGLSSGNVSLQDARSAIPSNVTVGVYMLTGKQIKNLVQKNVDNIYSNLYEGGNNPTLIIGGLNVDVDYNKSAGERASIEATNISIYLEDDQEYTVAISSDAYKLSDVYAELGQSKTPTFLRQGLLELLLQQFLGMDDIPGWIDSFGGKYSYIWKKIVPPEPEPEPTPQPDPEPVPEPDIVVPINTETTETITIEQIVTKAAATSGNVGGSSKAKLATEVVLEPTIDTTDNPTAQTDEIMMTELDSESLDATDEKSAVAIAVVVAISATAGCAGLAIGVIVMIRH